MTDSDQRVPRTGLVYDEYMARHKNLWDPDFLERPERITEPYKRCCELNLIDRCIKLQTQTCRNEKLLLGHHEDLVEKLKSTASMQEEDLKVISQEYDSVYFHNETYECSRRAVAGTITLMENIISQKVRNGLALVRPPGHHAMYNEFCGFCFFNNVGIAAKHAVSNLGLERIMIVDWDVHHGQATQYMFYDDPRVLYFSIHRYEFGRFWPHLRDSDYDWIGEGEGRGYNINVPLNQIGMTDSDYLAIFQQILMPVAYEFCPDLILISAGFDSAVGDPKGEMRVSPAAFAHFTHMLSGLAEGRVCAVLEGGYCLESLSEGVALTLRSLLGDECPYLPEIKEPCDSVCESILNVIKVLKPHWNCFCHQEILEAKELCPFAVVDEMPPRPDIEFSTADNRPDRFELVASNPHNGQDEISSEARLFEEIDALIQNTPLHTASYRTCFTCETHAYVKQMKKRIPNVLNGCFMFPDGEIESENSKQNFINTLERVLSGQCRNGIFITRDPVIEKHFIDAVLYSHEKHTVNRILIVEINTSKKNVFCQFPEAPRVLYIPFSFCNPDKDVDNTTNKWTIPIELKGLHLDADHIINAFHQIVLPIAYQKECSLSHGVLQHTIHMLSSLSSGRIMVIAQEASVCLDLIMLCTATLLGDPLPRLLKSQNVCSSSVLTVSHVLEVQKQNWSCLKLKVPIP